MHTDLDRAIGRLYAVFARHPLAHHVDYCTHCVGDDEALVLQQKPLRDLTAGDLERYTRKAMSTWGDEADFQHFLPRILELFATGAQTDDYLFIKTINNVRYQTSWPVDELDSVEQYLTALFRHCLAEPDPPLRAARIIEAAAENSHTVVPYLEIWGEQTGEHAALQLTEFVDDLAWTTSKDDTMHRESWVWLRTGIPARILETAFLSTGDPQTAASLAYALEQIEFLVNRSK